MEKGQDVRNRADLLFVIACHIVQIEFDLDMRTLAATQLAAPDDALLLRFVFVRFFLAFNAAELATGTGK